jgi:hypothetical protein
MNSCPGTCLTGKDKGMGGQRIIALILLVTLSGADLAAEK